MTFSLEFYRTRRGTEPALDYIRTLVKAHRAKIGRARAYRADWLRRFGGKA